MNSRAGMARPKIRTMRRGSQCRQSSVMNQVVDGSSTWFGRRSVFPFTLARGFVTVVISTIALIGICLLFAPSSLSHGALEGSLPFAAIIAIVGLGQLLVVQQGGFDLSLAGGVSLAVVISTHYPQGDDALLLPAVLIAIGLRDRGRPGERDSGQPLQAERHCRDYRRERAALWRRLRCFRRRAQNNHQLVGRDRWRPRVWPSEFALFRVRRVAGGFIHLEKVCGRKAFRSDRRKPTGCPGRGTSGETSSASGLCLCPAPLLRRWPAPGRHHSRTHSVPRRFPAFAFGCCRCSRRNVAAWWSWFSDLDRHCFVLPEPVEPIRTRSWCAVFGSNHHPGFGLGFWYRRLLCPVDGKHEQAN